MSGHPLVLRRVSTPSLLCVSRTLRGILIVSLAFSLYLLSTAAVLTTIFDSPHTVESPANAQAMHRQTLRRRNRHFESRLQVVLN